MVLEGVVDAVSHFVLVVGLPVLVILFYLEGLVVGKILQPPAVFVTVVAVTTPSWPILALLMIGCTVSVVAGQWTTYRSFDDTTTDRFGLQRRVPYLNTLPTRAVERIGERRLRIVDRLFARYGGIGLFTAIFIPGIRGLLAVPAGLSAYPTGRFLGVTLLGNALYFPLLVAVAYGILQLIGIR